MFLFVGFVFGSIVEIGWLIVYLYTRQGLLFSFSMINKILLFGPKFVTKRMEKIQ